MDFSIGADMTICNTIFQKPPSQLIPYRSGGHTTQIDLKKAYERNVKNRESVSSQYKLLVIDCEFNILKTKNKKDCIPKIKWWLLKNPIMSANSKIM